MTLPGAVPSVGRMTGKRLFRWAWLLAIVAASMRPASAQAPVPFNGIQAIVNDRVISRDEVLGAAQRELTAAARTRSEEHTSELQSP